MHRIGDIIDERYLLSRPLGVRQGAEMWEAEHQIVGRKVTLKLVALEPGSDVMVRKRLVSEARAASEIGHSSIVEIHDVGLTPEGVAYLVSEPLRGETLADIVARHGAMQPEDACQVMIQVLAGLEAAHAANVVHGDLHSDSVILRSGRSGQLLVKLLDFGVSEASVQAMTTPPSSERAAGRTIDVTSDLQSAGALLFEMLSGRSAANRTGDAQESNGRQVRSTAHSLVPAIPAALARVVDQAMSTAAARSIASAHDMATLLEPFAASTSPRTLAPRDTMMPFLSPEARKSRGMARLEKAVLGGSTRPNLVVLEGSSGRPVVEYGSRPPISLEGGSLRAPRGESIRHMKPEDLLEPRIPKAPRSPKHLGSDLPRFSRADRLERGPRSQKRSSLPLRKWKTSMATVSNRLASRSSTPPQLAGTSSLALQIWSAGLLAAAGLGAGLLLARLLHL